MQGTNAACCMTPMLPTACCIPQNTNEFLYEIAKVANCVIV